MCFGAAAPASPAWALTAAPTRGSTAPGRPRGRRARPSRGAVRSGGGSLCTRQIACPRGGAPSVAIIRNVSAITSALCALGRGGARGANRSRKVRPQKGAFLVKVERNMKKKRQVPIPAVTRGYKRAGASRINHCPGSARAQAGARAFSRAGMLWKLTGHTCMAGARVSLGRERASLDAFSAAQNNVQAILRRCTSRQ